jgi:hypothetical protein
MWQILFLLALLHEPDDHGICRSEVRGRSDPDCKPITIHNGVDTTPGDVLLAGLADAPTTEVTLDGVSVEGITSAQVHGRFATVTHLCQCNRS